MIGTLVVRADAGPRIGLGHLVRSLALAQAWQDKGGQVILATTTGRDSIPASVAVDRLGLVAVRGPHPDPGDLATLTATVAQHRGAWAVVDGYNFDADYTRRLADAGARVIVIDDQAHAPLYHAHVLLNQNPGAERLSYRFERPTTCLFGPRFAPLGRSYAAWRTWPRSIPAEAATLLVSVGGGTAAHALTTIIDACRCLAHIRLRVVVLTGPDSGAVPLAAADPQAVLGVSFEVVRDPRDMPALMAASDLAVSAAGSTVWQLCFMGVPSALLTLVQNQAGIADRLEQAGCAVNLGWHADLDEAKVAAALEQMICSPTTRALMSERGRALVDGRGAERVIDTLLNLQAA